MTTRQLLRNEGYLTTPEAAERAQVSPSTLRLWITRGVMPRDRVKLPSVRVGTHHLIEPSELSRFLDLAGRQPLLPFPPEQEAA